MSIILKGIDIPNSGQIEIIIRPHGKVFSNTRGISAEAIQIPKGHGDIKDVGKFVEDLKYDVEMNRTRYITDGDEEAREDAECKENCISFIESSATPTILEAEE